MLYSRFNPCNLYLMLLPPHVFSSKATIAVMIAVSGLSSQVRGAVSSQMLPMPTSGSAPFGLRGILPSGVESVFGPVEGIKGGFEYGLGIQASYDSNFFLSESDPKSEITANILPWISYHSDAVGGAPFSLTANYAPNIRTYLHNRDLDGVDNSGSVTFTAAGAKTLITTYVNYNEVSGTDRFSGTFVNGTLLETGIRGTYQIAPRTSLFATGKYAMSDYGSSSLVGADMYTAEVGGYWSATERFSFGPSIRYMREESSNTGTRDAWALSMQTRYLLGTKLQFLASLGLQYSTNSRDGGGDTLGLTGDLTANYAINDKLQWESMIRYVTVPSPADVNYVINDLTISTVLNRKLLRATASLGLEMSISDYAEVGPVGTQLGKENNLSAILSYRRKMFLERVDFDSSLRYTLNDGRYNWDQLLLSAGITINF